MNQNETNAAHVLILTKTDNKLFGRVDMRGFAMVRSVVYPLHSVTWMAIILYSFFKMQVRFDGTIGFPGGLIDPGEDVVTGLNRELKEELGLGPGDCFKSTNSQKLEIIAHLSNCLSI